MEINLVTKIKADTLIVKSVYFTCVLCGEALYWDEGSLLYYVALVHQNGSTECLDKTELVEPTEDGVWIVYGWDTMPYPLYLSKTELEAYKYVQDLGFFAFVKFWKFGDEFGSE